MELLYLTSNFPNQSSSRRKMRTQAGRPLLLSWRALYWWYFNPDGSVSGSLG